MLGKVFPLIIHATLVVCHAISQFWFKFQEFFLNILELVENIKKWRVFANELNVSMITIYVVSEMTKKPSFFTQKACVLTLIKYSFSTRK